MTSDDGLQSSNPFERWLCTASNSTSSCKHHARTANTAPHVMQQISLLTTPDDTHTGCCNIAHTLLTQLLNHNPATMPTSSKQLQPQRRKGRTRPHSLITASRAACYHCSMQLPMQTLSRQHHQHHHSTTAECHVQQQSI
jgi:hypothetical protein